MALFERGKSGIYTAPSMEFASPTGNQTTMSQHAYFLRFGIFEVCFDSTDFWKQNSNSSEYEGLF